MARSRPALAALAVATAPLWMLVAAEPASAHAEFTSSSPARGARLRAAPASVSIRFSEPPTVDAVLTVTDGCGDEVVEEAEVLNLELQADVATGQPGVWKATYAVVSAVDGHPTKGRFSFGVTGNSDCSGAPTDHRDVATGEPRQWNPPYLLWTAIALAIVAPAAIVRILAARRPAAPR
jgi:methionine-rich copper-binding protein CopC